MSVDSELLGVLESAAGVPVWGGRAPDNPTAADYPHVVIRMVDDRPMDATVDGNLTLREARYQVEPFAATRAAAKTIAEACIAALQGYRSANASPAGTLIRDVQFDLQMEMDDNINDLRVWSVPTDFLVIHEG